MIRGVHAMFYSTQSDEVRDFLKSRAIGVTVRGEVRAQQAFFEEARRPEAFCQEERVAPLKHA